MEELSRGLVLRLLSLLADNKFIREEGPHMASIPTSPNVTADPAADGALIAAAFTRHECAYCGSPIGSGQRWVREKIYDPFTASGPRYHRYHADLFTGEELSCWEKHEMEQDIARTSGRAA